MWQKKFEQYGNEDFTIVGLALDAEGVAPAKIYYDRFGVKFPALVDPNYATKFGAVPKTFFINEHGVILSAKDWEEQLTRMESPRPVTQSVRKQFQTAEKRLDSSAVAKLAKAHAATPDDLVIATQLASRYIDLGLHKDGFAVVNKAVEGLNPRRIAVEKGDAAGLLSQAYLQLARSSVDDRSKQVEFATMSFYLNPTIGFGKQIARIIAPEKFDGKKDGSFDNAFREGTLRRLVKERQEWLSTD